MSYAMPLHGLDGNGDHDPDRPRLTIVASQWVVTEPVGTEHRYETDMAARNAAADYATIYPGRAITVDCPTGVSYRLTATRPERTHG